MSYKLEKLSISAIRSLSMDMINKANSGHPGICLGAAPIMYTLYSKHLVSDPKHPDWINRDRFVLSAGHGSAMLYSTLHFCGYDISLKDLQNFRQLNSLTPGHPENGCTSGVDATSGPLGQGIAQAVGLAIAEASLAANFENGEKLCDHYTYCLCGDGCLQEGVSQESISLAGHLKLNKLILIYDSNNITLDGKLDLAYSESVKLRFISSGWNVLEVRNGNNVNEIDKAITIAKTSTEKPTLIIVKTVIGFGSIKQGTNKVHGAPIGFEETCRLKKEVYNYNYPEFVVPVEVYEHFKQTFINRGSKAYDSYILSLERYGKKHKAELLRFNELLNNNIEKYIPDVYPDFQVGRNIPTRKASNEVLTHYMLSLPNIIGGSADLASSNMTLVNGVSDFTSENRSGHNINFGIREFAMASIQNGILLHGGLKSFCATFFVFSDYMKPAIRMTALSKLPGIYLYSHDTIAVGEDGPTHQPIEQLAMLRSIPNLVDIRPCDEKEVYAAWRLALLSKDRPTAIITTRQNVPTLEKSNPNLVQMGAYVLSKEKRRAKYTLIASGSEVSLALKAQEKLLELGIDTRVVSMPSWRLFDETSAEYQEKTFGVNYKNRISIEMLTTFGWTKYAKHNIGIDSFGKSAPAQDVIEHFGFTVENIVNFVKSLKED